MFVFPIGLHTQDQSGIALNYVFNGDTNGVFYYIGYDTTWTNPCSSGKITTTFSGGRGAALITARDGTGTNNNNCYTDSFIGASITVDLKNRKLQINKYTIQMSDNYLLRSWDFEASNDNVTWTTLDSPRNTNYQPYEWVVRDVSASTTYQYFRIVQQGNDSTGNQYICIAELELYGVLSYIG